jgi:hypothetical protein
VASIVFAVDTTSERPPPRFALSCVKTAGTFASEMPSRWSNEKNW